MNNKPAELKDTRDDHSPANHGKNHLTQIAALVALGVSVGITAEVGAVSSEDELHSIKEVKEVDTKKLNADRAITTDIDRQLDGKVRMPVNKIEIDKPPPP